MSASDRFDRLDRVLKRPDPAAIHPLEMTFAIGGYLGVDLPYNVAVAALRTDSPLATLALCKRARNVVRSSDGFNFEPNHPGLYQKFVEHRGLLKWLLPQYEAAAKLILRDYGAEPPIRSRAGSEHT